MDVAKQSEQVGGKLTLPKLDNDNLPKAEQEVQECFKHSLDLFDMILGRTLEFDLIFLARGYLGSDVVVEFHRAFRGAGGKMVYWFENLVETLTIHGWSVNAENQAALKRIMTRYSGLRRYAIFFRQEDSARFRQRGAQILPQDRSAAEVFTVTKDTNYDHDGSITVYHNNGKTTVFYNARENTANYHDNNAPIRLHCKSHPSTLMDEAQGDHVERFNDSIMAVEALLEERTNRVTDMVSNSDGGGPSAPEVESAKTMVDEWEGLLLKVKNWESD
ncbi:MAG: hypothetical protein Q9226_004805 [Calogaya cf. arnoldii]